MALKLLALYAGWAYVVLANEQSQQSVPIAPAWLGSGYRTTGESRSIVRYMKSGKHSCIAGDAFTRTTCVDKLVGHFERKVVIKCMSCMRHRSGRGSLAQFCSEKPDENGDLMVWQVGYDDIECQQPQGQWGFLSGPEKRVPSVHAGCFQDDPFAYALATSPVAFPAPISCDFAEYSSLDRQSCFDSSRGASCKVALTNPCRNTNHGTEDDDWCRQMSATECMHNPHTHWQGRSLYHFNCSLNELKFAGVYYNFEKESSVILV